MRYITETKNLFDINSSPNLNNNSNITINGNSILCVARANNAHVSYKIPTVIGEKYTVSNKSVVKGGWVNTGNFCLFLSDNSNVDSSNYLTYGLQSGQSFTFTASSEFLYIHWYVCYNFDSNNPSTIEINELQVELGDTATPYVPYGYLPMYKGKYKVNNVCQLLDKSKYPATVTKNGVTFTNNGDGTITANGTSTQDTLFHIFTAPYTKNHIILLIGCPSGGSSNAYCINTSYGNDYGNGVIKKNDRDITIGSIYIRIYANITVSNLVFKPQLFDLTEMYGAGHEPTTVEQFRQDYPNELYEYTPYCWASMKNIRYLDTTKNLFEWLGTSLHPDDYANAVLIEIVQNGIILQGNDSGISQPNHYNNGWFRPGANYGTIANKVKLTAGDTVTISADYLLIDGPYNNTNIGIYLYGAANSTALVRVSKGKLKRVSATYPVTVTGEYYPVFTLNSSKVQITNIQVELGDTATPYVPYGYLPLK